MWEYESNHFLEQRKKIVTTTLASTNNKTTKVKSLKEDKFCKLAQDLYNVAV
jgi:lipase chaperone LimK